MSPGAPVTARHHLGLEGPVPTCRVYGDLRVHDGAAVVKEESDDERSDRLLPSVA
jgi:hypothetical protein